WNPQIPQITPILMEVRGGSSAIGRDTIVHEPQILRCAQDDESLEGCRHPERSEGSAVRRTTPTHRHWQPSAARQHPICAISEICGFRRCRSLCPYSAASTRLAAAMVWSTSASVWAVEMNRASKADGARYTPSRSMPWKNFTKVVTSVARASV